MKYVVGKLTHEQYRVLVDIYVTISQVTFGIAFATLIFPPLDQTKWFAILISFTVTIILWISALTVIKKTSL